MCPPKLEIFLIFPNFLRFCSATREGNSRTKFAILDIKFLFTCDESDLCQNIVKFQNVMTRIVANIN